MRPPDFWTRDDPQSVQLAQWLSPLGWFQGASVAYKARNAQPFRPRARVICVGNLTLGGTGKTPIAIAIARVLSACGLHPVFLSRGYRGNARGAVAVDPVNMTASEIGDEPLLLARAAPTIVARDRRAGAELADSHGFDVIVMDDGHQNFKIEKDLSLIVADAATGFGNGYVFPAGPLREPVAQGLARAQAVILTGEGEVPLGDYAGPVLRARLVPSQANDLRGKRVVAFAGIGRPEKFYATLRSLGAEIISARDYADHHAYSASEIARLHARARAQDAALITTEKDYMRLAPMHREGILMLPVEARFEDAHALALLLAPFVPARARSA